MNTHETTKISKNSFSFVSLGVAIVAISMGLFISLLPSHREYFPIGIATGEGDKDADAIGMEQFFFAARRNINTNSMDYSSMLAADMADRAIATARKTRSASSGSLPNFNWISMGPGNIGGRTRAILIDKNDPTRQTVFAGAVSGGIWKSTNGGGTWGNAVPAISYSINDTMANINVSCIAQDANGAIYIGTGEGFTIYQQGSGYSTGILGGGIFKSTDDGKTWRRLASTIPVTNSDGVTWAYVNRIAIRPDNFKVIYAATQAGLMVSHDSGTTWVAAINTKTNKAITGDVLDVKISNDGSIIVACIGSADIGNDPSVAGCYGYYCYPSSGDNLFTEIKSTGAGRLLGNGCRIEFAISPTDANRIYASVIQSNGTFGAGGSGSGIFMTMNAVSSGNGGYWYDIGPGGTKSFDPYFSAFDQANYDNTLGVPPANEAQVICGGATLWEWSGNNIADTVGKWNAIDPYGHHIHPDLHALVFDIDNPQTLYIGCDGGLYKCTDLSIDPANVSSSISSIVANVQAINRNYNVTQYYTVCYAPFVNSYSVPVSINNGTGVQYVTESLGMGGGTQDNGSPYINGSYAAGYPSDGKDMTGGDGAGAVVSQLNPNIAYFCSDDGAFLREGNLGVLSTLTTAYNESVGDTTGGGGGGDIDSAHALGGSSFVFPVALYENPYDLLNHDMLQYTATENDTAGQTIWPISPNGGITYPYVLPVSLASGKTLEVPDRVVSRVAVGFAGSLGGIWINGQGASNETVIWMPIGGPLSVPTPFTGNFPVHALAWTSDGNTLFAGTEAGQVFRFSNINSVIANKYNSGALWFNYNDAIHPTGNTNIVSTSLTVTGLAGRDILSIATDPNDSNNVLITAGNYGETYYVSYSSNALAANPAFTTVQGNLPLMPVYGAILDLLDSTGHYVPNSAMLATEHGIYTTTDITKAGSTKWVKNNNGLPNCLTLAIKQQTTKPWMCNNPGVIYVGTHGRGIWSSNTFFNPPTAVQNVTQPVAESNLLIYPNPMTTQGNIQFELPAADNVTITIYDMQGKEIKTMNMGNQSPGSHLVSFQLAGLSSGTYFAALTGSNFRKVGKFVVIQ